MVCHTIAAGLAAIGQRDPMQARMRHIDVLVADAQGAHQFQRRHGCHFVTRESHRANGQHDPYGWSALRYHGSALLGVWRRRPFELLGDLRLQERRQECQQ